MLFKSAVVFVTSVLSHLSPFGDGHHHHRHAAHHHSHSRPQIVCDARGCSDSNRARPHVARATHAHPPHLIRSRHVRAERRRRVVDANGNTVILGGRPAGCPYEYCGCEASRYVFGRIRPELNLAYNWIRKFPRATPAPGMAAVRNHHVFILMHHVHGSNWRVHDGNSGNHLTREHVRSIAGYVIVNPHRSRAASVD